MTEPDTTQHTPSRAIRYALVVLFASMLFLTGVNAWYATYKSDRARDQANATAILQSQQWCDLLRTINAGNRTAPPQSATGRIFAKEIRQLAERFHCPP